MSLGKAIITVEGPHGRGTRVSIDGIPLETSATSVELLLSVDDVNRLTIMHVVHIDEIEVEGVITFRALLSRTGGAYISGEGPSTRQALADLIGRLP
jgi:hypothetical protein